MLPDDTKQHREAASDSSLLCTQTKISNHFPEAKVIPYSDQVFQDTSIQWLIHTNQVCFLITSWQVDVDALLLQPIQVFSNLGFKKMLSITSQATKGVSLPCAKMTWAHIIKMFKKKMFILWDHLNICTLNSLTTVLSLISCLRVPLSLGKSV